MAKFEIEAKIGANSDEFKRKLRESAAESKEFARKVHENVSQGKEIFGEIAGEVGLGKVSKGLGSATVGAGLFGAAIAAAAIEGVKEFAKFEDAAFKFGATLGNMSKGREIAEFTDASSGHRGSEEDAQSGMLALLQTFGKTDKGIEEAKNKLLEFQNAAAETGDDVTSLADALRRYHAAGDDATKGGAKLLKTFKWLPGFIEEDKKKTIEDLRMQHQLLNKDTSGDIEAIKAEDNATYMAKHLKPAALDKLITQHFGPGGESGGLADAKAQTLSGQTADLLKNVGDVKKGFGETAAPVVKEVLEEFNKELPKLINDAKELGKVFADMTRTLMNIVKMFPDPEEAGKKEAATRLKRDFGMDIDPVTGAVTPHTKLSRDMTAQFELGQRIKRGGTNETELFGSNTGGKDLQQQQLEAMLKIEANTKEGSVVSQ